MDNGARQGMDVRVEQGVDVGAEQGVDDEARRDGGGTARDNRMKLEKNDLI